MTTRRKRSGRSTPRFSSTPLPKRGGRLQPARQPNVGAGFSRPDEPWFQTWGPASAGPLDVVQQLLPRTRPRSPERIVGRMHHKPRAEGIVDDVLDDGRHRLVLSQNALVAVPLPELLSSIR